MRLRPLVLPLVLSLFGACSCDEDPLVQQPPPPGSDPVDAGLVEPDAASLDATAPDVGTPDTGPVDTGIPPEPEGRVLRFGGSSPVVVYFGGTVELRFTLQTARGVPVANEPVRFTLAGMAGTLAAARAQTDASGIATVRYTGGMSGGTDVLTAEADRATSVTVSLEVHEDPAAVLRVDVASTARIVVTRATTQVWIGATPPTCAQLASGAPPAATRTGVYPSLPGSVTYTNEPSGALVTALATGLNARGEVVSRGCAEGLRLVGATTNVLAVTLVQLPSDLTGDYDVLLQVDVGAALPPPYGPVILTVTDVLSDPAGWAVYQTLAALDRQGLTTFVTWAPPGGGANRIATFEEVRSNPGVFNVWRVASAALDTFLEAQLGQAYLDVTNVGGDISHALRSFEVGAGLTLTATGTPDRLQAEEEWKALVFQWRLGCPNGDLGCARRAVLLSGARQNLAPARATYGVRSSHAPDAGETERYRLVMDPHTINLRYGAIALLVLEELVFPSLPGGLASNSLTGVLANVVRCPDVAMSIASATGLPPALFESLCTAAVTAAASALEARLLALDSVNNPGLVTGAGGGELVLVDADHDLHTELVPALTTYAAWSTPGSMPLSAPITGHGREAASGCRSDADCMGRVCAPIASYLEVRALEHDCRRPVGAAAGAVGCALDADCASGLCRDPGTGVRVCYSACQDNAACALGTCRADAFSVSLDPVLMGLGSQTVASCIP